MARLAAVLVILVAALAPLPVAQAQIGPNVPQPLTEEPAPPPPPPNNGFDDGGTSLFQKVLIFGAAATVLGVIAFVIVRDARKSAPVGDRKPSTSPAGATGAGGASGAARSARARERRQRAKRQKARAARQQRKRNRPQ